MSAQTDKVSYVVKKRLDPFAVSGLRLSNDRKGVKSFLDYIGTL